MILDDIETTTQIMTSVFRHFSFIQKAPVHGHAFRCMVRYQKRARSVKLDGFINPTRNRGMTQ